LHYDKARLSSEDRQFCDVSDVETHELNDTHQSAGYFTRPRPWLQRMEVEIFDAEAGAIAMRSCQALLVSGRQYCAVNQYFACGELLAEVMR
jgi:hypothetical protein